MPDWEKTLTLSLGIISLLVSLWKLYRDRQKRSLACEFAPIAFPIEVKAGEALEGDIEIRYRGQAVENLFRVRAKLENIGSEAIRASEVIEPVTFTFGPDTELVRQPKIIHRKPENLRARWELPSENSAASRVTEAILRFALLNKGEQLTTEFVCTGKVRVPKATARIVGISRVRILDPRERRWWEWRQKSGALLWRTCLGTGIVIIVIWTSPGGIMGKTLVSMVIVLIYGWALGVWRVLQSSLRGPLRPR